MTLLHLDEFSQGIAKELFAKFPDWSAFATAEKSEKGESFLSVTVPAPPEAQTEYGLIITTDDGVVTVGFDYFHTHFYSGVGDGERFGTEYAFHVIDEFLSERIAAISWWMGNDLVAFSTRTNGVNVMPPELIGPHNRERIRSWRGSLNVDRAV